MKFIVSGSKKRSHRRVSMEPGPQAIIPLDALEAFLADVDPVKESEPWQRPSVAPEAKIRSSTTGAGTAGPGRSPSVGKPDGRQDRIIVRGRTKAEVKDKLRTEHL